MFIHATNVTLYFPIHGKQAEEAPAPASGDAPRIGGVRAFLDGHRVVKALDDVSVAVERGDRLGIVGHNGSGKSTLLRLLAGIYHPHAGRVERKGTIAGIFNMSIGFRQEATGYRNILMKGLMAGLDKRQIAALVHDIEAFTGLGEYLSMPLHTYSQGMALRLAFAITTGIRHDILIMDEWIGAGDAEFQEKVVTRMDEMLASSQACIVASHNVQLLTRVCDRCLWLESGRVRDLGPTSEILEAYQADARAQAGSAAPAKRPIEAGATVIDLRRASTSDEYELHWNVAAYGVSRIRIMLFDPAREGERLFCSGPPSGTRKPGAWLRPGMEFRLHDDVDDELLGTAAVD